MSSAWQVIASALHALRRRSPHMTRFCSSQRDRWGGKKKKDDDFPSLYAILFWYPLCAHTQTHTHICTQMALLEVQAKRLTLKVGLLISRISGRSKRTIKGGGGGRADVFGGEGSLASQHMDMAMNKSTAEGVSLRSTAVHTLGRMQADWPS